MGLCAHVVHYRSMNVRPTFLLQQCSAISTGYPVLRPLSLSSSLRWWLELRPSWPHQRMQSRQSSSQVSPLDWLELTQRIICLQDILQRVRAQVFPLIHAVTLLSILEDVVGIHSVSIAAYACDIWLLMLRVIGESSCSHQYFPKYLFGPFWPLFGSSQVPKASIVTSRKLDGFSD